MSAFIGALRVTLGIDTAEFQEGIKDAQARMRQIGASMQSAGRTLSVGLTAPLAGFAALTLKTAGDFQASMNRVEAATGASADELARLRDLAKDLGRTTQFTASQSADAIEMLAKNGLDAAQILGGALDASLKLSAASGGELSAAADLATDVMLNFGKEAGDLGTVVDGVTGVLLASKFGFDDYRLALGQAGGVAGGLGVTLEDFNATIAATSARFASGSDAGTSFKTFLQRLVPASGPAAKAMEELGLEFFDTSGNMKSMAEVAEELRVGFAGLSDEAKNDALSTIFGTDALRTAIGLMEQGAVGIENLRTRISEASADEQAAARMKGLNGAMLEMKSALEAISIAIAESGLIEWTESMVRGLTGFLQSVSQLNPELLKWGTIVAGAAAAIGPLLIGLGLVTTAMAAISAPVLAAVAAVAAVAAGITALYHGIQLAIPYIERIGPPIWEGVKNGVTNALEAVRQFAADLLATVRALPAQMLQIGSDIMTGLANGIRNAAGGALDAIKGAGSSMVSGIRGIFDSHSPSRVMIGIGDDVMDGLGIGISDMAGGVTSMAETFSSQVVGAFNGIIDGTKSVKDAVADMLKSIASSMLNSGLKGLLGGMGGGGFLSSLFAGLDLPKSTRGGSLQVGGAFE